MLKAVWVAAGMACGLSLASPANADQKSDDVSTLLRLTGRNMATLERTVDAQVHVILQTFIDAHPDLTGAEVVTLEAQVVDAENQCLSGMTADMAAYYARSLSDGQIKGAIAFFKSPDGQAYLGATGGLAQQNTIDAKRRIPLLVRSIKGILQAAVKGLRAPPAAQGPG